ncbi:MAG: hypothetical protein EP340_08285 [Alphaproteobacteria bacterium]|nr:MAG: hypothetical protein EP340_08285 [Alphaproteobacteria bacterium]
MGSSEKSDPVNFDDLWNYADPVATREAFLQLANEGGEAYQLELKTQIARTYSLERDFPSAHATLDSIKPRLGAYPRVDIRYHLERGRAYNSAGDKEKAVGEFRLAFDMGLAAGEEYHTVDAAHMLAIAASDAETREKWTLIGLELAEKAEDPRARGWGGALANNLGWDKFDAGDYAAALDLFERSRRAFEERGQITQERIARWSKARVWRAQGQLDEALEEQLRQEAEYEAEGGVDGYVFEELGELYLLMGENEKAGTYFARAYGELSKDSWLVESEPERLTRMKELSGL